MLNYEPLNVTAQQQDVPSFAGHIILACVVFWLCNPLLGLVAFILAGALHHRH